MAATLVLVEIGERLRRQRKKLKMTQEEKIQRSFWKCPRLFMERLNVEIKGFP